MIVRLSCQCMFDDRAENREVLQRIGFQGILVRHLYNLLIIRLMMRLTDETLVASEVRHRARFMSSNYMRAVANVNAAKVLV